jgi:stress-induced morphogen
MAIDQDTLHDMIASELPGADIRIEDLRGDGDHYAVHIAYNGFEEKNRVQQHQMVYQALQGKMGGELHALQIHTSIPQQ